MATKTNKGMATKTNKTDLGTRLRSLRVAKGLTQNRAALLARLTTNYLSKIENNHRAPGARAALKLAAAYGVDYRLILPDEAA